MGHYDDAYEYDAELAKEQSKRQAREALRYLNMAKQAMPKPMPVHFEQHFFDMENYLLRQAQ